MKSYQVIAAVLLLATAGALGAVSLFSSSVHTVGPFQIGMSLTIFDQGFTKFTLPPFGSVRARTHLPPLQLTV
ncbi:MAG: hypothetical protein HYY09_01785, partial [Firmicutes bacterium]|nr:hypothetical protein [Bacillota bacterium]